MTDSPLEAISPDGDIIRGFSNPNYQLIEADALNSNLPGTQYYDDNHIYEDPDLIIDSNDTNLTSRTNGTKERKKYSQLDANSMGIDLNTDPIFCHAGTINSPDSIYSEIQSVSSTATSPVERTNNIVEVEHTEELSGDEAQPDVKPQGFLGYYASLEESAARSSAERAVEEEEDESDGEEEEEEEEEAAAVCKPLLEPPEVTKRAPINNSYLDKTKDINSPDSNDSGIQADSHIQHVQGPITDDLYAVVDKSKASPKEEEPPKSPQKEENDNEEEEEEKENEPPEELLPPGWEKHEDEDGAYYWHIKSGTIQRDPPPPARHTRGPDRQNSTSSHSESSEVAEGSDSSSEAPTAGAASTGPPPPTEQYLTDFQGHALKYAADTIKLLNKKCEDTHSETSDTLNAQPLQEPDHKPIRFAVRSLGWVRIAEEDLTPERSSKAVNKCIVDLSLGRNDINDVVGRWGEGKDLFLDLDDQTLTLTDPQDMSVLHVQHIQSIRVWGVGRDNGRDFAYVARDRATRKHMCHVFRCDTPARQIANTLRDICKRIMLEQRLAATTQSVGRMGITRPNNLPNLEKTTDMPNGQKLTFQNMFKSMSDSTSFPTPMEEPKKVIRCHYLGTADVTKPAGVEILNGATEKVYAQVPPEKWLFVNVAIAPSTLTISEYGKPENVLAECRVRYLSFMGIAMRNIKLCSFIMHSAQEQYVAHVFHCEPSAGALCKTIEAACKLRYQKCLDAHHRQKAKAAEENKGQAQQSSQSSKGLGASFKSVLGSIKGRKPKS